MKKLNYIIILIVATMLMASCNKIEGPFLVSDGSVSTDVEFPELDASSVYRKVLIEEYTGQRCNNCPEGHRELDALHERYGDTLVAIGLHVGTFAIPTPTFPNDFRTEEGTTLYGDFNVASIGTPSGVVNRTQFNNSYALNISSWQQAIVQERQKDVVAAVQLINVFDASTQTITAHTKTTFLTDYTGNVQMALYVIEDNIIGPQKDGDEDIPDYVHKHVLRGSFNGTYGTFISEDGSVENGGEYLKSYALDCKEKGWDVANCSVIAVLMDATSKEVLQVEQAKFF